MSGYPPLMERYGYAAGGMKRLLGSAKKTLAQARRVFLMSRERAAGLRVAANAGLWIG